jgi:hypothetical protein
MKKLFWACALALPLLALPAEAKATWCFGNYQVDTGAKVWFNVYQYGKPVAGPWYLYWPYEAHFQVAAPGVNPFFPPQMTLPPGFGQPPEAPGYQPPPKPGYQPPPPKPAGGQGYRAPVPQSPVSTQGYWYYGR